MPSIDKRNGFIIKPPLLQTKYNGLRREESQVLRSYLRDTGTDDIERLRTAVPVGEGEQALGRPEPVREQIQHLSKWKIDAVIDRPGSQEILELKSRATHTALGQVLAYDIVLGERDDEPTESIKRVVGFRLHPDLARVARVLGIQPHTVPDADASSATDRFMTDNAPGSQ